MVPQENCKHFVNKPLNLAGLNGIIYTDNDVLRVKNDPPFESPKYNKIIEF